MSQTNVNAPVQPPSPSAAIGSGTEASTGDLGEAVASYTAGFSNTRLFVVLGAGLALVPIVFGIGARDFGLFAVLGALLILPAALLIRTGLRQQQVRLTIRRRGFEYCDPKGNALTVFYSDVEEIDLLRLGAATRLLMTSSSAAFSGTAHQPNGIAVKLKNGTTLHIKCLSDHGITSGCSSLQECLEQSRKS